MSSDRRTGMVQTVCGLIASSELGHTMMHEHMGRPLSFSEKPLYLHEPESKLGKKFAHEPVTLENLWWIRYNMRENADNLSNADWDVWSRESALFSESGGGTIVEVTPAGTVNIAELQQITRKTGVHIIAGTGHYVEPSHDPNARLGERSVDEIAAELVQDILEGDPLSGGRAGVLGEIGCSWPVTSNERKVLEAVAVAQRETGVCISIHPGRNEAAPGEIRDILEAAGADLTRVVMGHMDRCGYELDTRLDLLDSGMTVEYDVFGMEGYYPASAALADGHLPDIPNDTVRIKQIRELCEAGFSDQIVVGHDIHMKFQMAAYGGWGYGHYLRNVVPLMEVWGVDSTSVRKLTIDNPARLLTIV